MSIRSILFVLLLLVGFSNIYCSQTRLETGLEDRVHQLQQELVSSKASGDARRQLKAILEAPEFTEKMRQASVWDRWKQRVAAWLIQHLGSIIKSIAQHPTTTQAIFWIGAVGALAIIAIYLFRLFRKGQPALDRLSAAEPAVSQTPQDWLGAARLAAERGELDKGIQCSYWAAITYLQSVGNLPRSEGQTPRELLKALRLTAPAESLRSLTSALEWFWYGRMPATAEDFTACLGHVEALGCKLD